MKITVVLRLAWAAQRSLAREVFQIAPLAQTQTERHRRDYRFRSSLDQQCRSN